MIRPSGGDSLDNSRESSFFSAIKRTYGHNACKRYKQYTKDINRLASFTSRKYFLLQCRRENIFPSHILNNVNCLFQTIECNTPFNNEISKIITSFRKKILNIEIKITFWNIKKIKSALDVTRGWIQSQNHDVSFTSRFFTTQDDIMTKRHNSHMIGLERKLRMLKRNQLEAYINANTDSFVFNATETIIPDDAKIIMGLGPKFGLPVRPREIPVYDIITDVESILFDVWDSNQKNLIRNDVTQIVMRAINNENKTNFDRFMERQLTGYRKFMLDHKELMVIKSDKGNKTVCMRIDDYTQKATFMLNDLSTYRVTHDLTSSIKTINNNFVLDLYNRKLIDTPLKNRLTSYNAVPPKMYFLPKYHKADLPLRPISSDLNGPTNSLAKYAASILAKLPKSKYHIVNSYDFHDYVTQLSWKDDEIMISFDVVSLFTNTPMNKVLDILEKRWNEIERVTELPKRDFIRMVHICTSNCYFQYKDTHYKQIFGTPMGSSISPILVEILLDDLLDSLLSTVQCELGLIIEIIKKYVDDLFLVLPRQLVDQVLRIFNGIEPRIQFTCERERENMLPFLDMTIHRCEATHTFYTNWYRKPISSGRLLNYRSLHPLNQKIGTVVGFIDRVMRLSDRRFFETNTEIIVQLLRDNDYPMKLINRLLHRYITTRANTTATIVDQPTAATVTGELAIKRYFSLPYVPNVSERIVRSVKSIMANVEISMKSFKNVGRYFTKLKDPTPKLMESNVVYSIPCGDCVNGCYIGTTTQLLKARMNQHRNDVKNLKPDKSALAYHALTNDHVFKFDDVEVVARQNNYHKRMFLEELFIKASSTCVNFKSKEAKNVNCIYTKLLEKVNSVGSRRLPRLNSNGRLTVDSSHTNSVEEEE